MKVLQKKLKMESISYFKEKAVGDNLKDFEDKLETDMAKIYS